MATTKGKIKAISISQKRGTHKANVPQAEVRVGFGIVGDAHAANWHRQVSLLAVESINKMVEMGAEVSPGSFAENITTEGIGLLELSIGTKLGVGEDTKLEITQIGKECHSRCAIFEQVGDCVMPREGIFAKVTKSGLIRVGDIIEVLND
ncbi:MAG: MOSC domain-containing protein [Planctomycetota bacterium]